MSKEKKNSEPLIELSIVGMCDLSLATIYTHIQVVINMCNTNFNVVRILNRKLDRQM